MKETGWCRMSFPVWWDSFQIHAWHLLIYDLGKTWNMHIHHDMCSFSSHHISWLSFPWYLSKVNKIQTRSIIVILVFFVSEPESTSISCECRTIQSPAVADRCGSAAPYSCASQRSCYSVLLSACVNLTWISRSCKKNCRMEEEVYWLSSRSHVACDWLID